MLQGFGARTYQQWCAAADLVTFRVAIKETELSIWAVTDLTELAIASIHRYRRALETHIQQQPEFQASFTPVAVTTTVPAIVHDMAQAAECAGVGPFAAVAGAIAEAVGKELLPYSPEVIVENGGDIFLASQHPRILGIYAGKSALTGKIGLVLDPAQMPCGVCTSSATVGPSISFGRADAALVIAQSTALADACATGLGNRVARAADIPAAFRYLEKIPGVLGAVVVIGDKIGAWGQVTLTQTRV
jgi:uncharacterized protein